MKSLILGVGKERTQYFSVDGSEARSFTLPESWRGEG